jgi:hypothetical protein
LRTFAAYHNVIAPKYGSEIFLHPERKTGHMFERVFRAPEPIYTYIDYPDGLSKRNIIKIFSKKSTIQKIKNS